VAADVTFAYVRPRALEWRIVSRTMLVEEPDKPPDWLPTAIQAVAIFLLIGGLWGVGSCIWQNSFFRARHGSAVSAQGRLLCDGPFALTAVAGALLWTERRGGTFLSFVVLVAQAAGFHFVDGLRYEFTTGGSVNLGITGNGDVLYGWSFGSAIDFMKAPG